MTPELSIADCPCGSGSPLTECCEPYISGKAIAPTAEALMRSRYTAYTQANESYLLATWHHTTRPQRIDFDAATQWLRLQIIHSEFDRVAFVATYRINGKAYKLKENSRFIYEHKIWLYLNGDQGS